MAELDDGPFVFSEEETTVRLKRGSTEVEFRKDQLTTETIGQVFSLLPRSVWLKTEYTSLAVFPDDSGLFVVTGAQCYSFLVEGAPLQQVPTAPNRSGPSYASHGANAISLAVSNGSSSSVTPPAFKSVSAKGKTPQASTIKVTKAAMIQSSAGKITFEKEGQLFVEVTEDTATVPYISAAVKREYGDGYILVTTDGLEILDRAATKGLKFWKVPSRKIFAIDANDTSRLTTSPFAGSSDHPPLKRRKLTEEVQIQDQLAKVYALLTALSKEVSRALKLAPQTPVPLGLKAALADTFKCKICHEVPMKPPLIAAKCCKILIGCSSCVDQWYGGTDSLTKQCPNCRTERGYSESFRFLGFDDFIASIQPLFIQEASTAQ